MQLAFITDLHIDKSFEYPFGIDTRQNFKRILNAISKSSAEELVIGGDLCYRNPEPEIYEWIFEELKHFGMPFHVIAGNHDDSLMMSKIGGFDALLNENELYFAKKFKPYVGLFLDTSKGVISKNQMNWLDRQIYQHSGPTVIFMHHPPIYANVPFMDDDPSKSFSGGEKVMEILAKSENVISIFTGHYHVEKTVLQNNAILFITPSCFFQIDQNSKDFKVDHHRIGYRLIDLDSEGLKSSMHYMAGSRQMDK